jgi:hypothetical protein
MKSRVEIWSQSAAANTQNPRKMSSQLIIKTEPKMKKTAQDKIY